MAFYICKAGAETSTSERRGTGSVPVPYQWLARPLITVSRPRSYHAADRGSNPARTRRDYKFKISPYRSFHVFNQSISFHTLTIIVRINVGKYIVTTVIIQWFIMVLQCVNLIHPHAVHNSYQPSNNVIIV